MAEKYLGRINSESGKPALELKDSKGELIMIPITSRLSPTVLSILQHWKEIVFEKSVVRMKEIDLDHTRILALIDPRIKKKLWICYIPAPDNIFSKINPAILVGDDVTRIAFAEALYKNKMIDMSTFDLVKGVAKKPAVQK